MFATIAPHQSSYKSSYMSPSSYASPISSSRHLPTNARYDLKSYPIEQKLSRRNHYNSHPLEHEHLDTRTWIHEEIRTEYCRNTTTRTHGRYHRCTAHQNMSCMRSQSSKKIKHQIFEISYPCFDIITKDIEKKHIPYQMHSTPMQKHRAKQRMIILSSKNMSRNCAPLHHKLLHSLFSETRLMKKDKHIECYKKPVEIWCRTALHLVISDREHEKYYMKTKIFHSAYRFLILFPVKKKSYESSFKIFLSHSSSDFHSLFFRSVHPFEDLHDNNADAWEGDEHKKSESKIIYSHSVLKILFSKRYILVFFAFPQKESVSLSLQILHFKIKNHSSV